MSKLRNLSGQTFGQITVLDKYNTHRKDAYWECECQCGKKYWVRGAQLTSGKTKSCGHYITNNFEVITDEKGSYVIIELTRGQWASCDINDWFDKLEKTKWYAQKGLTNKGFYAVTRMSDGERIGMHTMLLNRTKNKNKEVDHIDRDTTNNRRYNLRLCTRQENLFNKEKTKNNTTGYIGVYVYKKRWITCTSINGKNKHLGLFDTIEEAAIMVDLVRLKLRKEFCGELNFPELRDEYLKSIESMETKQ